MSFPRERCQANRKSGHSPPHPSALLQRPAERRFRTHSRNTTTSSITQPFGKNVAFRYAWSSVYTTRPDPRWTSTTLTVGYRQSILRKWLVLETAPFVTWEEQYKWEPGAGIAVSLNVIFEED